MNVQVYCACEAECSHSCVVRRVIVVSPWCWGKQCRGDARSYLASAHPSGDRAERADLASAVGDAAGWEYEPREALRIYAQMDATNWVERIEQELAS